MKRLAGIVAIAAGCAWVMAADEPARQPAGERAAVKPAPQKLCPVTGQPVDPKVSTDYKGTRVSFCCPACIPKFKADPTKYLPAVYREIYPQRVQVKCAAGDNNPINPKVFADYKGQRVYFCCEDCAKGFKEDPAGYLKNVESASTRQVHDPANGQPINAQYSVKYQDKPVYFSSKDTLRQFNDKPDKYAAALRPEVGVLAYGPTADQDFVLCPACAGMGMSGVHQRKEVRTIEYQGKTYFAATEDCEKEFKSDPAKYARVAEQETKKRTSGEPKGEAMPMDAGQSMPAGHQHQHH